MQVYHKSWNIKAKSHYKPLGKLNLILIFLKESVLWYIVFVTMHNEFLAGYSYSRKSTLWICMINTRLPIFKLKLKLYLDVNLMFLLTYKVQTMHQKFGPQSPPNSVFSYGGLGEVFLTRSQPSDNGRCRHRQAFFYVLKPSVTFSSTMSFFFRL